MICPVVLSRQGPGTTPSHMGMVTVAVVVVVLFALVPIPFPCSKFIFGITGYYQEHLYLLLCYRFETACLSCRLCDELNHHHRRYYCHQEHEQHSMCFLPRSGPSEPVGICACFAVSWAFLTSSSAAKACDGNKTESERTTAVPIIVPNIAFDVSVLTPVCYYILCYVTL